MLSVLGLALSYGVYNQQSPSLHSFVDLILDVARLVYSPFKISSPTTIIILIPLSQKKAEVGLWVKTLGPEATGPLTSCHLMESEPSLEILRVTECVNGLHSFEECFKLWWVEHYYGIVY